MTLSIKPRKNGCAWPTPGILQGLQWCAISLSVLYCLVIILPQIPLLPVTYTIYGVIVLWHLVSQILVTATDPKDDAVSYKTQEATTFIKTAENQHVIRNFHCQICKSMVTESTKHCRSCNKCTEGFDHHCVWLNNCVGTKNYRYFFSMVISTLCVITFTMIFCIINIIGLWLAKPNVAFIESYIPMKTNTTVGITIANGLLIIVSLCGFASVSELLYFHIFLVQTNQTTYGYLTNPKRTDSTDSTPSGSERFTSTTSSSSYAPNEDTRESFTPAKSGIWNPVTNVNYVAIVPNGKQTSANFVPYLSR